MNNQKSNIIKAVKAKNRQQEINDFGKSICWLHIKKSKKLYSRKVKHKK